MTTHSLLAKALNKLFPKTCQYLAFLGYDKGAKDGKREGMKAAVRELMQHVGSIERIQDTDIYLTVLKIHREVFENADIKVPDHDVAMGGAPFGSTKVKIEPEEEKVKFSEAKPEFIKDDIKIKKPQSSQNPDDYDVVGDSIPHPDDATP